MSAYSLHKADQRLGFMSFGESTVVLVQVLGWNPALGCSSWPDSCVCSVPSSATLTANALLRGTLSACQNCFALHNCILTCGAFLPIDVSAGKVCMLQLCLSATVRAAQSMVGLNVASHYMPSMTGWLRRGTTRNSTGITKSLLNCTCNVAVFVDNSVSLFAVFTCIGAACSHSLRALAYLSCASAMKLCVAPLSNIAEVLLAYSVIGKSMSAEHLEWCVVMHA